MRRLEVSCAVRRIYTSLGAKGLSQSYSCVMYVCVRVINRIEWNVFLKSVGKFQVRWGDKHGGYGEHYWDYNHAGHVSVLNVTTAKLLFSVYFFNNIFFLSFTQQ